MSNSLRLEMTGETLELLEQALELAPCYNITVIEWDRKKNCLKLFWKSDEKQPQLIQFRPEITADVVFGWLSRPSGGNPSYSAPVWPLKPDIDGDCKKGWRIFATATYIEIYPQWMIYGK